MTRRQCHHLAMKRGEASKSLPLPQELMSCREGLNMHIMMRHARTQNMQRRRNSQYQEWNIYLGPTYLGCKNDCSQIIGCVHTMACQTRTLVETNRWYDSVKSLDSDSWAMTQCLSIGNRIECPEVRLLLVCHDFEVRTQSFVQCSLIMTLVQK